MNEEEAAIESPGGSQNVASLLLRQDIYAAWKYATRAVNCSENSGCHGMRFAMAEIVVKLSQQLEFIDTMLQDARVAERRERQTPAGGER